MTIAYNKAKPSFNDFCFFFKHIQKECHCLYFIVPSTMTNMSWGDLTVVSIHLIDYNWKTVYWDKASPSSQQKKQKNEIQACWTSGSNIRRSKPLNKNITFKRWKSKCKDHDLGSLHKASYCVASESRNDTTK